jgi:hypothetical protein
MKSGLHRGALHVSRVPHGAYRYAIVDADGLLALAAPVPHRHVAD